MRAHIENECITNVFDKRTAHALTLQMVCDGTHSTRIQIDAAAVDECRMTNESCHRPSSIRYSHSAIKMHPSIDFNETAIKIFVNIYTCSFRLSRRKNYIDRIDDIRLNVIFFSLFCIRLHVYDGIAMPIKNTHRRRMPCFHNSFANLFGLFLFPSKLSR